MQLRETSCDINVVTFFWGSIKTLSFTPQYRRVPLMVPEALHLVLKLKVILLVSYTVPLRNGWARFVGPPCTLGTRYPPLPP